MSLKAGFLFVTLLIGSYAQEQDMSIFFDHTDAQTRIVGGTISGRVQYMVALTAGQQVRSLVCGGSVITKKHVLTAAHCVEALFSKGKLIDSLRGTVGTNRWNSGGTQYSFAGNFTHPNYNSTIIKNDLGILAASSNIVFSDTVQPVVLNHDFINAGVRTSVTGWGRTWVGGPISRNLLQLSSTVLDGDRCVTELKDRTALLKLKAPPVDPQIEICTINIIGRGTCNGDSGGPLVRADDQHLIGLVSWGLPCALGFPNMYTRTSAYSTWIQENTN